MPTPSELAEKREDAFYKLVARGHEAVVNHEEVEEYRTEVKQYLQNHDALLLENVAEMAEGMKKEEYVLIDGEKTLHIINQHYNVPLSDLSLKLREEAKIIRGDK